MKYVKYSSQKNTPGGDENVFWVTMSDLLLGARCNFYHTFRFCNHRIYHKQSQRAEKSV